MGRSWTRVACAAVFVFCLAPSAAFALDAQEKAAAKAAFKAGQEHINAQRYGDAIAEFTKAYKITKDGLVMGQIAIAFEKGGDYERALEAIKIYRSALPASDRGPVDKIIRRYKKAIAAGKSKRLLLPHERPAKQPDTAKKPDNKTGGAKKAGGTKKLAKKDRDPLVDDGGKKGRFWTWIAAGTAGALALGALVVGLNAQSKFDELETTCKPACADADVDSVKTRAIVADVLWGFAGAALVTATVLFFLEGRGGGSSDSGGGGGGSDKKKDPLLDDDDLVKSIKIAPMLGRGGFGLGATIRY
ncbi:MAG: hypothetical protein KC503_22020 [Myxococcales bacterium]|nr:hypothetical protein [Myxococcales bacterium]